jgi:hypothetical protein
MLPYLIWDDEFVIDVHCLCRCTFESLDIVNYVFPLNLISVVQWNSMPGLAYIYLQTKGYSTVTEPKKPGTRPSGFNQMCQCHSIIRRSAV